MQTLQQASNALSQSLLYPKFCSPVKETSAVKSVHIRGRFGSLTLRCRAPLQSESSRSSEGTSDSSLRPRAVNGERNSGTVAMAGGKPKGLGCSLEEGYKLTNHVVTDENSTVEATGDVIAKLKNGFKTFKEGVFKQKPELYDKLAEGQEPKVMIISCADSRVCPAMLHGLEAGEAFVVRNVANMVPPCEGSGEHHGTSAAIEFAVTVLGVENIVVMGHSSCGGIRALMSRDDFSGDFVGSWVRIGMPAKRKTLSLFGDRSFKEQCSFCEQEAVNLSLSNLLTFPFIKERFNDGRLQIYGMHYDFIEGKLTSWQISQSEATVLPKRSHLEEQVGTGESTCGFPQLRRFEDQDGNPKSC